MAAFVNGQVAAFDALFRRYENPLRAYLTRMSGSRTAAEDLLQTTFLSVVRARGRFRPGAAVRPWLYAIATNATRDWQRRAGPRTDSIDEVMEPAAPVAEEAGFDPGLDRAVQVALAKLPENQRLPIVMHRFQGMSFGEIAEVLGISHGAAKLRAHRGYERLRELLASLREEAS